MEPAVAEEIRPQQGPAEKRRAPRPSRPRPKVTFSMLKEANGFPDVFHNFPDRFRRVYKGKGHEVEDLENLLLLYCDWFKRVVPGGMSFDTFVAQLEALSSTADVQLELKELRNGIYTMIEDDLTAQQQQHQQQQPLELSPRRPAGCEEEELREQGSVQQQRQRPTETHASSRAPNRLRDMPDDDLYDDDELLEMVALGDGGLLRAGTATVGLPAPLAVASSRRGQAVRQVPEDGGDEELYDDDELLDMVAAAEDAAAAVAGGGGGGVSTGPSARQQAAAAAAAAAADEELYDDDELLDMVAAEDAAAAVAGGGRGGVSTGGSVGRQAAAAAAAAAADEELYDDDELLDMVAAEDGVAAVAAGGRSTTLEAVASSGGRQAAGSVAAAAAAADEELYDDDELLDMVAAEDGTAASEQEGPSAVGVDKQQAAGVASQGQMQPHADEEMVDTMGVAGTQEAGLPAAVVTQPQQHVGARSAAADEDLEDELLDDMDL